MATFTIGAGKATATDRVPSPSEITALVQQLGHEDWKVRDAATEKLKAIGAPARSAVITAFYSGDMETARRAQMILEAMLPPLPELSKLFPPDGDTTALLKIYDTLPPLARPEVLAQIGAFHPSDGLEHCRQLPPSVRDEFTMLFLLMRLITQTDAYVERLAQPLTINIRVKESRLLAVAEALRKCGWIEWARVMYEELMETTTPPNLLRDATARSNGASRLSWLYEGRGEFLKARDTLQASLSLLEEGRVNLLSGNVDGVRARIAALEAKHYRQLGDSEKLREAVLQLYNYAAQTDTVITLYEILVSEGRQKDAVALVEEARRLLKARITESPQSDELWNNLAYMLGRTGQYLDEALTLAQRAIAARPNEPNYHGTLAEIYFQRRDFEKAVQSQQRALSLRPNDPFMVSRLKLYREERQ